MGEGRTKKPRKKKKKEERKRKEERRKKKEEERRKKKGHTCHVPSWSSSSLSQFCRTPYMTTTARPGL